jgi:hypothetical protein
MKGSQLRPALPSLAKPSHACTLSCHTRSCPDRSISAAGLSLPACLQLKGIEEVQEGDTESVFALVGTMLEVRHGWRQGEGGGCKE